MTTETTTVTSFEGLCEYLRTQGVLQRIDGDAQVTECATTLGLALFLRWERELPLVQIVQLVQADIPVERLAATEHAIALINHAAPLAGLALDHERRFAYFRITLHRDDKGRLDVLALNRALHIAIASIDDVLPLLGDVVCPLPEASTHTNGVILQTGGAPPAAADPQLG